MTQTTDERLVRRVTVPALRSMKRKGERISMITAYDATFARMLDEAGADVLLVCSDVDGLFEARQALADHATEDAAFAARLEDAAHRSLALRRSCPPQPLKSAAELEAVLGSERARRLEQKLAASGGEA